MDSVWEDNRDLLFSGVDVLNLPFQTIVIDVSVNVSHSAHINHIHTTQFAALKSTVITVPETTAPSIVKSLPLHMTESVVSAVMDVRMVGWVRTALKVIIQSQVYATSV